MPLIICIRVKNLNISSPILNTFQISSFYLNYLYTCCYAVGDLSTSFNDIYLHMLTSIIKYKVSKGNQKTPIFVDIKLFKATRNSGNLCRSIMSPPMVSVLSWQSHQMLLQPLSKKVFLRMCTIFNAVAGKTGISIIQCAPQRSVNNIPKTSKLWFCT